MKRKGALLFIGLTCFLSWSLTGIAYLMGVRYNTPQATAVMVGYMFAPMIVAILLQKIRDKQPLAGPLGISFRLNRWWLLAWLLPPAVSFATIGVSLLLPGVGYSPGMAGMIERFRMILPPEQLDTIERQIAEARVHPVFLGLLQGLIAGPTINAVAGFGEELGWRGYLQEKLGHMGFYRSSFLIGLVWGFWHMPLILQGHNYPEHPVIGVFMMVAWCVLLAPIFGFVRMKARSVIAAAVIHGSLNATLGLAIMVVEGGNDLLVGTTGLSGFVVLTAVNLLLLLYRKKTAADEDRVD